MTASPRYVAVYLNFVSKTKGLEGCYENLPMQRFFSGILGLKTQRVGGML